MTMKLTCLLVCPDTAARARLKDALSRSRIATIVNKCQDCRQALEIATTLEELAIVFVHSTIPDQQIRALQQKIGELKLRYKPIFVVTLHTDQMMSEYISAHMVNGVEGFLKEPFSATDCDDVVQVAFMNRQNQVEDENKNLTAIQLMIIEALGLIDSAALERLRRKGRGGGFARRRMNRLTLRIRESAEDVDPEALVPILEAMVTEQANKLDLSEFKRTEQRAPFAKHPGKVLTEVIAERELSPERLCELLSVDNEELLALLQCEGELTPTLSKQLARVVGNTSSYWLSLQKAYDSYVRANLSRN